MDLDVTTFTKEYFFQSMHECKRSHVFNTNSLSRNLPTTGSVLAISQTSNYIYRKRTFVSFYRHSALKTGECICNAYCSKRTWLQRCQILDPKFSVATFFPHNFGFIVHKILALLIRPCLTVDVCATTLCRIVVMIMVLCDLTPSWMVDR
jgi:hypothetical protein